MNVPQVFYVDVRGNKNEEEQTALKRKVKEEEQTMEKRSTKLFRDETFCFSCGCSFQPIMP